MNSAKGMQPNILSSLIQGAARTEARLSCQWEVMCMHHVSAMQSRLSCSRQGSDRAWVHVSQQWEAHEPCHSHAVDVPVLFKTGVESDPDCKPLPEVSRCWGWRHSCKRAMRMQHTGQIADKDSLTCRLCEHQAIVVLVHSPVVVEAQAVLVDHGQPACHQRQGLAWLPLQHLRR